MNCCESCAEKEGAKVPSNHLPTWWVDVCGLCGEEKSVTDSRDFGAGRRVLETAGAVKAMRDYAIKKDNPAVRP